METEMDDSLIHGKFKVVFSGLVILSMLFLTSCASEMSTRATRVRLVPIEKLQDVERTCNFLGNVQGQSYPLAGCLCWWCVARSVSYNNAMNELLDNAAEIGATHVFVTPGTYPDLRGVAYRCCYCRGKDGKPDRGYCMMPDGTEDTAHCQDTEGNIIGEAYCSGAPGDTESECLKNGGMWIQEIDETTCREAGHNWIPAADDEASCEARGGTWFPVAEDQVTCEEVKGGDWVIDEEVMRRLPESETLGQYE